MKEEEEGEGGVFEKMSGGETDHQEMHAAPCSNNPPRPAATPIFLRRGGGGNEEKRFTAPQIALYFPAASIPGFPRDTRTTGMSGEIRARSFFFFSRGPFLPSPPNLSPFLLHLPLSIDFRALGRSRPRQVGKERERERR